MKKEIVGISFENEKLDALIYHMGKKDADLQNEIGEVIQKLYEKYVPQATREYIEDKLEREPLSRGKAKKQTPHIEQLSASEV